MKPILKCKSAEKKRNRKQMADVPQIDKSEYSLSLDYVPRQVNNVQSNVMTLLLSNANTSTILTHAPHCL